LHYHPDSYLMNRKANTKTNPPMQNKRLIHLLRKHRHTFAPVVNFNPGRDKIIPLCFTRKNKTLTPEIFGDTASFCKYVSAQLKKAGARYGIGGYHELRALYGRSELFNTGRQEPRRLHLGTDIWGRAGEKIYAPMDGWVHSFANNNNYGDYGATIITQHQLEELYFYILYGHCSLQSLKKLQPGMPVRKGKLLATLGTSAENGHWPPHLHFQLIADMGGWKGDYPGVCAHSEKKQYLCNSPRPDYVLNMDNYAKTLNNTKK
jgi:peptidoglycan LD-endopeptidase LytH